MNASVLERVEAGAARLDGSQGGPGWEAHVDLTTLNMQDPRCCTLGQLYGDYDTGATDLGIDRGDEDEDDFPAYDLGFDTYYGMASEYEELTEAWRELVRARKGE